MRHRTDGKPFAEQVRANKSGMAEAFFGCHARLTVEQSFWQGGDEVSVHDWPVVASHCMMPGTLGQDSFRPSQASRVHTALMHMFFTLLR